MKKALWYCLFFLFVPMSLLAQHSSNNSNEKRLRVFQDTLERLGKKIINSSEELERKNANYNFIKTFTSALKVPGSFKFGFDSVKSFTILRSPDNKFRIFTWHVMNQDGSYRFYGTIQMNTEGPLVMYPLADYTPFFKNPADTVTENTKWYGAQYYEIIPVSGPRPYYVLLGWKGNNVKSTQKVIEVLSFQNNHPVLGMNIFSNSKDHKRIIFEYTRQASMLLKFVPEKNLIVFDHLAPPDPHLKDHPETFGPDLSYDGYKLQDGRWKLVQNLDMRNNMGTSMDAEFEDPRLQAKRDLQQIPRRPKN
jgi:hypothetical protein